MRTKLLIGVLVLVATIGVLRASDRVAVYGKVDRVVFEPAEGVPDAIQVWGVFSVAERGNPNDYHPAAKGYLYFSPGKDAAAARREWSDLKSVAATGQIVAFGSRWESGPPRVRQAADKPASPDAYAVNTGVTKITGRTDYAPIRALIEFKP
jgi:hypothetical protein